MPANFGKKQVEISFRRFLDYSNDVLSSNSHTFNTRFNILLHHCENDEVMSVISSQLKSIDVHFEEWWEKRMQTGGSFIGSKIFDLPVDEKERAALLYQFCLKVNCGNINIKHFCIDFFGTSRYDEMVWEFNNAVVGPMVRSINYKLEEICDVETDVGNDREIPINVLYVYQDLSTNVNGDVITKGDAAIGGDANIEKKKLF